MIKNLLLLMVCLLLIIVPFFFTLGEGPEEPFRGTDNQAADMTARLAPDYKPWYDGLWEAPSPFMEGVLFTLQAATGALLVGYCLGFLHGKYVGRREEIEGSSRGAGEMNAPD